MSPQTRRLLLIGLGALIVGVAMFTGARESAREKLDRAGVLLSANRFEEAGRLAESIDPSVDEAWEAYVLAGEAFTRSREYERAKSVYERVPDKAGRQAVAARGGAASILLDQRLLGQAEDQLRRLASIQPDHPLVAEGLAHVLNVSARRHEAVRSMLAAASARRGPPAAEQLVMLADIERPFGGVEYLELCRKADALDPLPMVGLAAAALAENDTGAAERLAQEALDASGGDQLESPGRRVAHRILGLVLAEGDREREFVAWHRSLTETENEDPLVWLARGLHAHQNGQLESAARCLWEALDLQPNLRQAAHLLGQCLQGLGREEDAEVFLERARKLEQLVRVLEHVEVRLQARFTRKDGQLWEELVSLLKELGRTPEARHWARAAIARDMSLGWARTALSYPVRQERMDRLGQTVARMMPTRQVDLSDLPLPDWSQSGQETAGIGGDRPEAIERIRFEDVSREAGISFEYFQSPQPETAGARMFENTGGGVAILDYDQDGWPDVYLTQGTTWPGDEAAEGDVPRRDRLFRNNGDGTFHDVTDAAGLGAGLGDERFSQGVAVGDIDHDGWPDVYVANIGGNRLFRNNSDGTFGSWPLPGQESADDDRTWTTSCVVADIDGDGHVDLFDVNYLSGSDVFTKICRTQGIPFACHPNEFDGADDRFWRGDGAGGFVDATRNAGFVAADGKGLGVVVARTGEPASGPPRLGLFIANDAVANHFYLPTSGGVTDQALSRGVAYDRDGRPQACMGVAAGDADGDGRLDLFVTNFYAESNVLYRQVRGGTFTDTTRAAELREPGWKMLGFGTQFLDVDLDGRLDLVIANGHVDDLSQLGQPYRMTPQVMWNRGGGRFVEVPSESLGPFFERKLLGRGLARGDLDRDGKDDFVVSHLDDPVAVLMNRTSRPGHSLSIRLVSVRSARDAIGTRVSVTVGGQTSVHQLTAGDGYQASNQRQLVVGLGSAAEAKIVVDWPSGQKATIPSVPADGEIVVIEGRDTVWRLPLPERHARRSSR